MTMHYVTEIAGHLAQISEMARRAEVFADAAVRMENGDADGVAALDDTGEIVKLLVLHGGMANVAAQAARNAARECKETIATHAAHITVLCHELCAEMDKNPRE